MEIQKQITGILNELADRVLNENFNLEIFATKEFNVLIEELYADGEEIIKHYRKAFNEACLIRDRVLISSLIRYIAESAMYHIDKYIKIEKLCYSIQARADYIFYAGNQYIDWLKQKVENENQFVGRGVVYTVLTGNYEPLKEPLKVIPGIDYICFTDNVLIKSNVWQVRLITNEEKLNSVRLSRKPKILFHNYLSEYDYSIYMDTKFQIVGDILEYVKKFSVSSAMLACPHFVRNCLYEEAEVCKKYKTDEDSLIDRQLKKYRDEGFPENYGLIDAGVMVRNHHDTKLMDTMETWWKEYMGGSRRDQLCFTYACWKNSFLYDLSAVYSEDNCYFCNVRG